MKIILFTLLLSLAQLQAGGLQTSKLQPSGRLNAAGKAAPAAPAKPNLGNAHSRIKGGFYVNADGSLGARVVPTKK